MYRSFQSSTGLSYHWEVRCDEYDIENRVSKECLGCDPVFERVEVMNAEPSTWVAAFEVVPRLTLVGQTEWKVYAYV